MYDVPSSVAARFAALSSKNQHVLWSSYEPARKNRGVATALAIFGFSLVYVEKYGLWAAYMLTAGGLWLWWAYEIFAARGRVDSYNATMLSRMLDSAEDQIARAEEKRLEAEQYRLQAAENAAKRLAELSSVYGKDTANRIVQVEPRIGDTMPIIEAMMGIPADTDIKQTKTKTRITWKYHPVAKGRYGVIFVFEGDELVSWEDKR